jgi:DNA-binding MarR family transcriptional regulator
VLNVGKIAPISHLPSRRELPSEAEEFTAVLPNLQGTHMKSWSMHDRSSPMQPADYSALGNFRYELRKFLRASKELLATQARLTMEQYEALLALKAFAPDAGMLVGQLSERLQVRHHTTVALTNRLAGSGLITKQRSEADRRHVYVQLTPAGDELIQQLALMHRNALREGGSEMIEALHHLRKES